MARTKVADSRSSASFCALGSVHYHAYAAARVVCKGYVEGHPCLWPFVKGNLVAIGEFLWQRTSNAEIVSIVITSSCFNISPFTWNLSYVGTTIHNWTLLSRHTRFIHGLDKR